MPTFTPPKVQVVPPVLPDTTGLALRLFRHFESQWQYVGVYILTNNTIVQDYATAENSNTNVPLPWNMDHDPYMTIDGVPYHLPVEIDRIYTVPTVITAEEASYLTSQGYGGCITP